MLISWLMCMIFPIHDYLSENPTLRMVLLQYPQRKVIFTNSDAHHAQRVLNTLRIADLFEQIIDIGQSSPGVNPKPKHLPLHWSLLRLPTLRIV